MAYTKALGSSVQIRHPVWNLAGTALMSGQAANLTYTITSPSGVVTTTGIVWTEPNADGWYLGTITLSALGVWAIRVDNGGIPASDQALTLYQVDVVSSAAGVTPVGTFLTTVANFKEQIGESGSSNDAYYTNLIARASHRIERLVGRPLVQASYTEYHDGRGLRLNLRRGPIQSVTSVSEIAYATDGVETATLLAAGLYFTRGTAAEGWHLPGWLEYNGGTWTRGQRNWKVVYSAGYSQVPYDLEAACLDLSVAFWNQRKDAGVSSRDIGAGLMQFRDPESLVSRLQRELAPYMDMRAA